MSIEQVLGINFFNGEIDQVIDLMSERGGFLVAPSGTCFARLRRDQEYRTAMSRADVAIADSGAMVLLWKLACGRTLRRISGLRYLRRLTAKLLAEKEDGILWVLPNEKARGKTASWLEQNDFQYSDDDFYIAPIYTAPVEDASLVERIQNRKPRHVVIGIGSGPQEKLGYYLREKLSYRPAIHCIGAALGFMIGEQVKIPMWADRFYLGWLFRLVTNPTRFLPRLWRAVELPFLIFRYRENLPPLGHGAQRSGGCWAE